VVKEDEQRGITVVRIGFGISSQSVVRGMSAKNLTDWADIHFRIDLITKVGSDVSSKRLSGIHNRKPNLLNGYLQMF
jgi:hypothetical protein